MKIVSWNANGKFREKIRLFDPGAIDVMVVQECERTEKSEELYRAAGWKFHWIGENRHKGLGIFVPINRQCEKLSHEIQVCRYFLPVRVSDELTVMGVWAMGGKSASVSYAGQITRFLESYMHLLEPKKTIFVGDFNSNSIWDKRHRNANHTNNDAQLNEIGLKSLYHEYEGEKLGEETKSTFFMYRKQEKPYHIDYAYLPEIYLENSSIEIGCWREWLEHSDHMPLIVDLNF